MIPIYRPYLNENILKYAHDALDSGWISSKGKYKTLASELLQEKLNAKYVYLTSSGTAACHLMIKVVEKLLPKIKKFIVPNNSYVAVWNSLLFDKERTIIPIDANISTWNMDIESKYNNINSDTLVYIVHNLGNIINVPRLKQKYKDTVFIEDSCEGILGKYGDKSAGSESFCSASSFFGNKNISCGEGGAVSTNNEEAYTYIKHISEQAESDIKFVHTEIGYNYRMSNIHSAILYGQLKYYDEIYEKKCIVMKKYNDFFKNTELQTQLVENETTHSNWMYGIKCTSVEQKTKIQNSLIKNNIETRPMFCPMSYHKHLNKYSNILDEHNAKNIYDNTIILPSYPGLTNIELDTIINTVTESF